jgi:hypothetical protein
MRTGYLWGWQGWWQAVEVKRMLQVVRGEFTAHFENGEIIGEYVCIHVRNCGQHFRMPDCQSQPLG